uniref:Uncharacterized protein n=1 Tax=Arundo donax TaxID=35708 RepID=A0A0A9HEF6_ARUDO
MSYLKQSIELHPSGVQRTQDKGLNTVFDSYQLYNGLPLLFVLSYFLYEVENIIFPFCCRST